MDTSACSRGIVSRPSLKITGSILAASRKVSIFSSRKYRLAPIRFSAWADTPPRPELLRGYPRAFRHRHHLRPYHVRIHGRLAYPGAVAAVASRDDVLAADQLRVAPDPLGDELRVLDEIGFRLDHAGDQHFAFGQLDRLENLPFVGMTGIGGLERDSVRPRKKNDVDDVFERYVAVVRPFVVAPAQVHAHAFGRNVRGGAVERFDVQPCFLAEFFQGEARVLDVPPHGEVGAIDLQDDPGLRYRFVLVAHGIGDGEKIRFLAVVVLVPEKKPDHAGRGGAHEHFLGLYLGRGRFQVLDVIPRALGVAHADRRIAPRGLPARAARVAEHALGEVRELDQVLIYESVPGAAEAGEAVLDVGGVAGLRHLAVVDDVDARPGLPAHDLLHRGANARAKRLVIDRHALLLGVHHAHEILRPRQAARMGGEKALRAAFHSYPRLRPRPIVRNAGSRDKEPSRAQ